MILNVKNVAAGILDFVISSVVVIHLHVLCNVKVANALVINMKILINIADCVT